MPGDRDKDQIHFLRYCPSLQATSAASTSLRVPPLQAEQLHGRLGHLGNHRDPRTGTRLSRGASGNASTSNCRGETNELLKPRI